MFIISAVQVLLSSVSLETRQAIEDQVDGGNKQRRQISNSAQFDELLKAKMSTLGQKLRFFKPFTSMLRKCKGSGFDKVRWRGL